jgi:predicted PurR-regulated permease PerM
MSQELILWIKKILIIVIFGLIGLFLYNILSLIIILAIAGFFTILVNPLVDKGEARGIPAWVTTIGIYILIFLLGSIVIGTLIPIVINYVTDTATLIIRWANSAQNIYTTEWITGFHFHPYIERGILFLFGSNNISHTLDIIKQNAGNIQLFLTNQISTLTTNGISIVSSVWGVVAEWGIIAVMSFLMVLERKAIGGFILNIAPENMSHYLHTHYIHIQKVCNAWIKATLILSGSIFLTTYIGLIILKLIFGIDTEKTFTLALISGIMEFIPYLGPIIALVPALIIGFWIGMKAAFIITILYIIIQQIENNFLVPYVMSKSLDLSPFLVFIVMFIGASLGGIMGIILAVPLTGIARVIYVEYMKKRHPDKLIEATLSPSNTKFNQIRKKLIAFYKKIDKNS